MEPTSGVFHAPLELGDSGAIEVRHPDVGAVKGHTIGTVMVRLDPNCEHPEERRFAFDPPTRARERFPQLVTDGLTALRYYLQAGCPGSETLPTSTGNFTAWDRIVRACLIHLGYADPITTQKSIGENDPMRQNNLEILRAWFNDIGSQEVTINDIQRKYPEVSAALQAGKEWNPLIVAHKLRKMRGRVIGDYKLIKAEDSTHGMRYTVMCIGKKPSVRCNHDGEMVKPKKTKY